MSYSSNITDFKLKFHEGFLLGSAKATIFGCEFPMILLFWAARSTQVSRCCLYPILRIHKFFVLESLLLVRHHHLQSKQRWFSTLLLLLPAVCCVLGNDCQWKHQKRSIKFQFLIVIKANAWCFNIETVINFFFYFLPLHLATLPTKKKKHSNSNPNDVFNVHELFPFLQQTLLVVQFNFFSLDVHSLFAVDGWVRNREQRAEAKRKFIK